MKLKSDPVRNVSEVSTQHKNFTPNTLEEESFQSESFDASSAHFGQINQANSGLKEHENPLEITDYEDIKISPKN